MYDWLLDLAAGERVLDVGSAGGSFPLDGLACTVIAVDEDPGVFSGPPAHENLRRVTGRSGRLPIASQSIDLVICNHAMEHFLELDATLVEIRRVLKPGGRLYTSVPNGYGLCDAVYRWVFQGGGHVNRFRRDQLVRLVESQVGVRLARRQKLYSSFVYLHGLLKLPKPLPEDLQPRVRRIARLPRLWLQSAQCILYAGTRLMDRVFGTELAVYGWALWFDRGSGPAMESAPYVNVCMYCGTGHPAESAHRMRWRSWQCAACGGRNPLWMAEIRRPPQVT